MRAHSWKFMQSLPLKIATFKVLSSLFDIIKPQISQMLRLIMIFKLKTFFIPWIMARPNLSSSDFRELNLFCLLRFLFGEGSFRSM